MFSPLIPLGTGQACVVKGVPPRKILETNGSIPGVTVGTLSYCERGLRYGWAGRGKEGCVRKALFQWEEIFCKCWMRGSGGSVRLVLWSPVAKSRSLVSCKQRQQHHVCNTETVPVLRTARMVSSHVRDDGEPKQLVPPIFGWT